jgi:hypothetical protein
MKTIYNSHDNAKVLFKKCHETSKHSGHLECSKLIGALLCHLTKTYHINKMSKVILFMSSCAHNICNMIEEHEHEHDLEFDFMGPLVNPMYEEVRLNDSS